MERIDGKNVLITGGLGFIGSNLAIELVRRGCRVTIIDNFLPGHGANEFNIDPIVEQVDVNVCDVRDEMAVKKLVRGKDVIFHLAGQINHLASMRDPFLDVDINVRGALVLLEACRQENPDAVVLFSGTRGQYGGTMTELPVNEDHPRNPRGMYGVTNNAAEQIFTLYHNVHGLKTVSLRITNTYGPRHQMMTDEYGVFNWFVRKALDDEAIQVFGQGKILRDFMYIDDLVDILVQIPLTDGAYGRAVNVGSGEGINFIDLAKTVVASVGTGSYEFADFDEERKAIEPGDYVADITLLKSLITLNSSTPMDEGIKKTAAYYRKHKKHYW